MTTRGYATPVQSLLGTFGPLVATLGVALLGMQAWIATQTRNGEGRKRAAFAVMLPWLALAAGAVAAQLEVSAQLQAFDAEAAGGPLAPYRARLALARTWADLAPGAVAAVLVAGVGLRVRRMAPTPTDAGAPARADRARVLAVVAAAGALAGAILAGGGLGAGAHTGPLALVLAGVCIHAGLTAWRPERRAHASVHAPHDNDDEATVVLGTDVTRALRATSGSADAEVTTPRGAPVPAPAGLRVEALTLAASVAAATLVLTRIPVDPALVAAAEGLAPGPATPAVDAATTLFVTAAIAVTVAGWVPALLAPAAIGGIGRRTTLAWGIGLALAATPAALAGRDGEALAARAGAQARAVLEASVATGGAAARFTAPLPTRVLVAHDAAPRWVNARPRGGVDTFPLAAVAQADASTAAFGGAGAALVDGDGVLLDPRAPVVDLYLLLSDARARSVALVSCAPVPVPDAPLDAAGRCLATPLSLQRPRGPLRAVILLKNGEVDDAGEVRPLAEVRLDAGAPVLVRAQVDARVSDLLAALAAWEGHRLVLGWGVDLDGEPIPVGARP